ncbi:MAG TPA: TIGR01777 family oxidoreductase [Sphingobacteriaceae bacterium]|nr:TIGR01777 family oxidoreductase [Sphingobacteriaceae bacterium]
MKAVIAGGTGFIGKALTERLLAEGWEVTVLTRREGASVPQGARAVVWPARPAGSGGDRGGGGGVGDGVDDGGAAGGGGGSVGGGTWEDHLTGADLVVNLAGAPIAGGRWTNRRKELILNSRIEPTKALVEAFSRLSQPPAVFINSSAVGYYGPRGDELITEEDGPGDDFLSHVCRRWEEAAVPAEDLGVRTIMLRIGLALGRGGGALPLIALPFRLLVGGPIGSGRQWWPWIHVDDVVGLITFLSRHPEARGPINATAPQPVTNKEFARTLGRVLGKPAWLPAPAPALRLVLGEMADAMLLSGQRVIPQAARALGYRFQYEDLTAALEDLLK